MLGPAGEMNAIPGEAGVDYPVYNTGIMFMMMVVKMMMINQAGCDDETNTDCSDKYKLA